MMLGTRGCARFHSQLAKSSNVTFAISQRQPQSAIKELLLARPAPMITVRQVPLSSADKDDGDIRTWKRDDGNGRLPNSLSHDSKEAAVVNEGKRRHLPAWIRERLIFVFFPQSYPRSVTRNYLPFSAWNFVGSVSGTMTGVLATQSLLTALGMGSGSLPLAASLNWIIKDGFGLLGGVLYTGFFSGRFDSEPKRYRFMASCALQLACLMEMLTVLAPSAFLISASVSNIGKNIAWLALSGTRAQMNQSLCLRDNLGDVTAKAGSQSTAAGLIGTGGGVVLSALMGSSLQTSLLAFVPLSIISLYSVYRSNAVISTRSLNLPRAEELIFEYFKSGTVLSPEVVGEREVFIRKFTSHFTIPLRIGPPRIDRALENSSPENLFIYDENGGYCIQVRDGKDPSVNIWFGLHATAPTILQGFYHACRLRTCLNQHNETEKQFYFSSDNVAQEFKPFLNLLVKNGWNADDVDLDHGSHGRIQIHRQELNEKR